MKKVLFLLMIFTNSAMAFVECPNAAPSFNKEMSVINSVLANYNEKSSEVNQCKLEVSKKYWCDDRGNFVFQTVVLAAYYKDKDPRIDSSFALFHMDENGALVDKLEGYSTLIRYSNFMNRIEFVDEFPSQTQRIQLLLDRNRNINGLKWIETDSKGKVYRKFLCD
ncbi:MAG: hypothetical protein ACXWRE_07520 [Pseudobdellovibrionaceae bacterium]